MTKAIRRSLIAALPIMVLAAPSPAMAWTTGASTQSERRAAAPRCTFETLSEADRRRYQSRYRRRVRIDGQAFADAWLQENACPTAAQQEARTKRVLDRNGRPCRRTRSEMRVTPGFDGAMTMTPVAVCAD